MKTARVGILSAIVLVAAAAVGVGFALAGGSNPWVESGVGSSYDHQQYWALETSDSPAPYVEDRPVLSFEDQDLQRTANPHLEDMQMGSPVETGSVPAGTSEEFIP
jgi:hypothetical protein